ncbi:hypothetical protein Pd630_LPD04845 [Rhodococcus opacus PD630]|nr:hypothetical protein Pd630_LPD04845 [Rhodococcus opacus PD630]
MALAAARRARRGTGAVRGVVIEVGGDRQRGATPAIATTILCG